MSRVIVFSHANGFPAGTYRALFEAWRAVGYAVHAVEKYGHDPRYPVTNNWPHLRDQLIHCIEREANAPAWLVGHSLGGYLSLMAASRRPELARGVVLLDSPLVAGWKARALQFAKATGLSERFSPGRVSRRRRQTWDSADAAHAHFASKTAFARFAPEVLRDYIESATEEAGNARRLSFEREVETDIYNNLPHQLARVLRVHPLRCPLAFVHGRESEEVRQVGVRATERLARGRVVTLEGGHLFPFERPAETAAQVLRLIDAMRDSTPEPVPARSPGG
ncbi:MAG: alpha/beta hydrolase [Burkholderiaceae bacterium]